MTIRDRLRPLGAALGSASRRADVSRADLAGGIDGQLLVSVPTIDDVEFGKSSGLPAVLELRVDVSSDDLGGVGKLVKQRLFETTRGWSDLSIASPVVTGASG